MSVKHAFTTGDKVISSELNRVGIVKGFVLSDGLPERFNVEFDDEQGEKTWRVFFEDELVSFDKKNKLSFDEYMRVLMTFITVINFVGFITFYLQGEITSMLISGLGVMAILTSKLIDARL